MTNLSELLRELDALTRPAPWSWTVGGIEAPDHDGELVEIFERESRHVTTRNENELIVALRNHTPEIIAALEAVERVRELHVPTEQEVIAWGCVYGQCDEDHPDDCPILTITTCAECSRLVFEETDEPGNVPTFPCTTIRALDGE